MLRRAFRLHEGDLLDLALQDQEAARGQVDPFRLQQRRDFAVGRLLAVDEIVRRVVAVGRPRDDEVGAGDLVVRVLARVDDLLEVDRDPGGVVIAVARRGVDELRDLVEAELFLFLLILLLVF